MERHDGGKLTMSKEEAETNCRLGRRHECCGYLGFGPEGFLCLKTTELKSTIDQRLAAGAMTAKGEGDWDECLLKAK